jgi:hypothetical protein
MRSVVPAAESLSAVRGELVSVVKTVFWGPADTTGGPLDEVFDFLRAVFPELRIERISLTRPADDNNVWYLSLRGSREVQLDSAPNGEPPFLIESDFARERTNETARAVEILTEWLRG